MSALAFVPRGSNLPAPSEAPARLRIYFRAGLWHLTEDGTGRIGGVFSSLAAAVAYARSELRGVRGARVVFEWEGSSFDGQG